MQSFVREYEVQDIILLQKNEPLVRNLSVLDKNAINWLRCISLVRLIDTDKNLGTALVESQWIEDQVQICLNKMTRHITEAEASQKIIAGAQSLGVITDRAIESSVIEEKQKSFLLVNSSSNICTRKDPQAANLQQAHW